MTAEGEKLMQVIDGFESAILATQSRDEGIHGRPMSIAVREGMDLWFVTSRSSKKIDEMLVDQHAMVAFQSLGRFACLSGTVRMIDDPELVHRAWRESWRPWFKNPDDPSLMLIQFRTQRGEYWDASGASTVRLAWNAAKAAIRGETVDAQQPWTHGVVQR